MKKTAARRVICRGSGVIRPTGLLDAEYGIEMAHQHHPALMGMHLHKPSMNGIEAIKALRPDAVTPFIAVLALTASAVGEDTLKKHAGAV